MRGRVGDIGLRGVALRWCGLEVVGRGRVMESGKCDAEGAAGCGAGSEESGSRVRRLDRG